jgi:HEAT repeat protein
MSNPGGRAPISGDEEARRAAVAALTGGDDALAQLVEALGDESWRVRKEAALRAASWADPARAVAALVAALAEPENVGRRNAAVEGLARLGERAVMPLLEALVGRPEHRKLIVDTLGMIRDRRAVAPLGALLDDPDPNIRAATAEALGMIGGGEAETLLLGALAQGELLLSLASIEALNRLQAVLPRLQLEALLGTPVLKPSVLGALGHTRDPAAAQPLLHHLADASRAVREAATAALHHLHLSLDEAGRRLVADSLAALPPQAEPMLVQALLEASPPLRRAAGSLLGLAGRASAAPPLALALGDEEVQDVAALALIRIGPPAMAPLAAMLAGADGPFRAAIYRLLPELGPLSPTVDARMQQLLIGGLTDEDAEAASAAARALGESGGVPALAPLVAALARAATAEAAVQALTRLGVRRPEETRELIRARGFTGADAPHLCRVLGACGRLEDGPLLLSLLRADAPALRGAAAESLAVLGGSAETEDALCFALADEAAEVRLAAARALARFPSSRTAAALQGAAADAEPTVRAAAVRALGTRRTPSAVEALRALVRSTDGAVAVHALEALAAGERAAGPAASAAPSDEEVVLEALRRDDAEVVKAALHLLAERFRAAAAEAAGPEGPPLAAVIRALEDARWDVRRAAAAALAAHDGPAAREALRARGRVEDDAMVREVIHAALTPLSRKTPPG